MTPARRRSLLVGLAIGVAATAAIVGVLAYASSSGDTTIKVDDSTPDSLPVAVDRKGDAVPTTSFVVDGKRTTLTAYRGKPLVVNFYAEWCVPCKKELPDFQQVSAETADRVQFIGIDVQDDKGIEFARSVGVTYTLGTDRPGDLYVDIGGVVMPTTVLINGDGIVAATRSGATTAATLRDLLRTSFPGSLP